MTTPTPGLPATTELSKLIPEKYSTPLILVVITVAAAVSASLAGGISEPEAWSIAGVGTGAVVTYIAPLLVSVWAAALKVLGGIAGGVLAAIPPIVDSANGGPGWTGESILIVVFAGLNALAAQAGVDKRIEMQRAAILDPNVDETVAAAVDPKAYAIAEKELDKLPVIPVADAADRELFRNRDR